MQVANPNKKYKSDDSLVYSCQYHAIFCPKYRRKVLINGIDQRFKELVLQKQQEYKYEVIEMEVMADHVHLLLDVNPKVGIYQVISKIKGYTSKTLRDEYPELVSKLPTLWTNSRFISTVGAITLEVVKKYIEEQKNV